MPLGHLDTSWARGLPPRWVMLPPFLALLPGPHPYSEISSIAKGQAEGYSGSWVFQASQRAGIADGLR